MLQNTYTKPAFPTFFKVIAFPQFLRYAGEIDMEYHTWMEYGSLRIADRCNIITKDTFSIFIQVFSP